jgi:hypothetical protein
MRMNLAVALLLFASSALPAQTGSDGAMQICL